VRKDFAVESFFFVAAAAYSQLFCELLDKYLLLTTITTVLRSFFRDHPGEPVPEENFGLYGARED